jgi:PEP-CTERM motif
MNRRFLLRLVAAGLTSVLLLAVTAPVPAGTVVLTDSGGSSADLIGTATGATLNTTAYADTITNINGVSVSIPLSVSMTLTDSGGVITGTGEKFIGVSGAEADIKFSITSGAVFPSFVNLSATMTGFGPGGDGLPGYTYASMVPGGPMTITLTTSGGGDFTAVFNNPGASLIGIGFGIHESATVPEPASMALLGIGVTGFIAFRRFFTRRA